MQLTEKESEEFRKNIEAMCRAAGKIHIKHWRNLDAVEKKGDIDLVTISDKEAEEKVINMIQAIYPDHDILAEESGARGDDSEYLWIIDPLDGTTNFAHGIPIFSVSIGLQHKGKTIAGGVYAPAIDEMYLATLGHGTTRDGKKVTCSKTPSLIDAMVVTGFPYNRSAIIDWILENLRYFISNARGVVRFGSAAYDLASIAGGSLDIFYEANLHSWDMCAGALLVTEAGGKMSSFSGGEFDLYAGEMIATNGTELHKLVVEQMKKNPHPSEINK